MTAKTHHRPRLALKTCAHCGEPLDRDGDRGFKGDGSGTRVPSDIWLAHLEGDPYCSRVCCEAANASGSDGVPGACLDCGKPFSNRRNGLSGPRCRGCANAERYRRYFFAAGVCAHCGCDRAVYTLGCWPCGDRRRRRERRAAEKSAACSPVSQASARVSCTEIPGGTPIYSTEVAA